MYGIWHMIVIHCHHAVYTIHIIPKIG
eukprot:COSAG03_NODE_25673_length_264_cov_0.630303_1_plen_26_part_01